MSAYVYIRSEPGLWTVGFYRPDGKWEPESDHNSEDTAAARAAWLNGAGPSPDLLAAAQAALADLEVVEAQVTSLVPEAKALSLPLLRAALAKAAQP